MIDPPTEADEWIEVSGMRIADVLRGKGHTVATVGPGDTVGGVVADLARHNVGALVVVDAGVVIGIVTERDVVRHLHRRGANVLACPVVDIMTTSVRTCLPTDGVDELAEIMTERRIRHLPVVVDGDLVGIVSIGDVVKARLDTLTDERDHLINYVQQ